MSKVIILLCTSFLICGCSTKSNNVYNIVDIESNINNWSKLQLSDYVGDIEYIPLETNGESLLISSSLNCQFSDSFILACDLEKCLVYDYNRMYINEIGNQGRDPGEYNHVSNAKFGSNGTVYIQDLYDLLIYRLYGTFIEKNEKVFYKMLGDNGETKEHYIES